MDTVVLRREGHEAILASHATRFHEKLLGRRFPGSLDAVLIETSSVHTWGLDEPLGVVGLDGDMKVVKRAILAPNRIVWWTKARRILELAAVTPLPEIGETIVIGHG